MSAERRPPEDPDRPPSLTALVKAGPEAVRTAADLWWKTGRWTLDTSWRVSSRLGRAVVTGENPADVWGEAQEEAREYLRRALGVVDLVATSATNVAMPDPPPEERPEHPESEAEALRRRGAELLRLSADVEYEEHTHPAYERIVGSMAPDEARILRHLCQNGPQPAVDVRGAKGIRVQMELIAPGLQMLGQESGCRYLKRVPAYLNNLERLGLIWFSREPLPDPREYQVLEAQPEVQEAMAEATRSKTVRRSIHLTPFGQDFCAVVLPEDAEEAVRSDAAKRSRADGGAGSARRNGGPQSPGRGDRERRGTNRETGRDQDRDQAPDRRGRSEEDEAREIALAHEERAEQRAEAVERGRGEEPL